MRKPLGLLNIGKQQKRKHWTFERLEDRLVFSTTLSEPGNAIADRELWERYSRRRGDDVAGRARVECRAGGGRGWLASAGLCTALAAE